MRTTIFSFLLMLLTVSQKIYSQSLYEPQGIGGGGAMSSFSMSPYDSNLWFVATDMSVTFRSTNQGESWEPIDQAQITYNSNLFLSVPFGYCADPNVIFYSYTGNRNYRSTDKGITWHRNDLDLNSEERVKYWLPHSENENIVFCGTDERLFISNDKGVSYIECNISGPSMGTFIDYQEEHLYHATRDAIYRSDDLGETFTVYHVPNVTPINSFTGGRDEHGLTLAYIDGDGVNAVGPWIQAYIGLTDGATQTHYDRSIQVSGFVWVKGAEDTSFSMVEHHQTYDRVNVESDYLYAGGGTYLTGGTFDISRNQYQPGGLYMAENNSQVIYTIGHDDWPRMYGTKTFVSTNGGQTFEKRFHNNDWDNGYIPWPADKLEYSAVGIEVGWWDSYWDNFSINQRDASMAGGTGYFFLHVTKDTGHHWLAPFTEFVDEEPREAGKKWRSTGLEVTVVHKIEFNPYNTDLMYMALSDIGGFMSEDAGYSLRMCDFGLNTNYDYDFDPDNTDVVYAAASGYHAWPNMWYYQILEGRGGIFRSSNRGRDWTRLTPDGSAYNRSFLSMAYDASRDIIYGGSHGDGVARSLDNGITWEYFNTGIPEGNGRVIPQIELDTNGNVYALLTGDFLSSSNYTNSTQTGIYFLDVVGGASQWQLLRDSINLPPEIDDATSSEIWKYPTGFAVDPGDPNTLWLIDFEIQTWLHTGIWKSTDRGQNWFRVQQFTHPTHIMIDKNNPDKVYVSGKYYINRGWGEGGLLYTTDGGDTWDKNTRIPFKRNSMCATLDPNDSTNIWYGFYGAGMLHGPRPEGFANPQSPGDPENFLGSIVGSGTVLLTWDPSTSDSDIKGYYVHCAAEGSLRSSFFTEQNSFYYTDVLPGRWHHFQVVAVDMDDDYSGYVSEYLEIPDVTPVVDPPTNLTATAVSTSQINLSWDPATGTEPIAGYTIYRDNVLINTTTLTSYLDTGLEANTEYTYRVSAYDQSNNESDLSNPVAETTLADPVTEELTFSMISQVGANSSEVIVPVIVQNFQDIATIQFSVNWDADNISFLTTGDYAFASLDTANFGTTISDQGQLTLSWNKDDVNGESLNDNDTLFSMHFLITGVAGDSSIIELTGNPLIIEVTNDDDELLDVTMISGKVDIIEDVSVTIAGKITNINSVPVDSAAIQLTGSGTGFSYSDENGDYSFSVDNGNFELEVTEVANITAQEEVTVADITALRRHLLGTEPMDSPYKIIAGDVSFSNSLSTRDIRYISDVILGVSDNFDEKIWKFVPAAHTFADNSNPFPCPENWQCSNLENDTVVDFIAVKLGDVDVSFLNNLTKTSSVDKLSMSIFPYTNQENQLVIPFRADCSKDISGFQYTLEWDKNSLKYASIDMSEIEISYSTNKLAEGKLGLLWYHPEGIAKSLNEGLLFNLKFDIIGSLNPGIPIQLTSSITKSISYDAQLEPMGIELIKSATGIQKHDVISSVRISPNPFHSYLNVDFKLGSEEIVEFTVINITGNIIDNFTIQGRSGENNIKWDVNRNVKPGMYFIHLKSNSINTTLNVNYLK